MKKTLDSFLAKILIHWVDGVRRHARLVVASLAAVTVALAIYTGLCLGINSDNVSLVPDTLPSRQAHENFIRHFPNLEEAIFVVVDARTPELAREAADRLLERLKNEPDTITRAYQPGSGEFFQHNGLLYRSVDELDDFADDWATRLAAGPPLALQMSKRLLANALSMSLSEALDSEAWAQSVNFTSQDTREGVVAFMEKRPPRFRGR